MGAPATAQRAEEMTEQRDRSLYREVEVRPMVPEDVKYIYGTWLNFAKGSTSYGAGLKREEFFPAHHRVVDAILVRARVLVAHPIGNPDEIAAYVVTDQVRETPVLHFGWTRGSFRGHGVMARLWEASGLDANECAWSHPTPAREWILKKYPGLEPIEWFK